MTSTFKQLPDGRWQEMPVREPQSVQIWYMRDNHTFRELPLDVEVALAVMREERDAGQTHGMLCGHPTGVVQGVVHAGSADDWGTFERTARPWLEETVRLSLPPSQVNGS